MDKPAIQPAWNDDVLTAEQNSNILARSRSTLAGYIARFPELMIEPVTPGSTRRYSIGKLTSLCLVRQMVGAGLRPDIVRANIANLRDYSATLFESVQSLATSGDQEVTRGGELLRIERAHAYAFQPEKFAVFVAGFASDEPQTAEVCKDVNSWTGAISDLQGFPLSTSVFPIDAILKNCWGRALTVLNGHELYD